MNYDFGPGLHAEDVSGVITRQPPAIRQTIPVRMPKVDADGTGTSGVPSVLHQAPLGTHNRWNIVAGGFFKGQPFGGGLVGGYVPFACTQTERVVVGPPALAGGALR